MRATETLGALAAHVSGNPERIGIIQPGVDAQRLRGKTVTTDSTNPEWVDELVVL